MFGSPSSGCIIVSRIANTVVYMKTYIVTYAHEHKHASVHNAKTKPLATMLIAIGHLCTAQVLYRSSKLLEAVLYLTGEGVSTQKFPLGLFEILKVDICCYS